MARQPIQLPTRAGATSANVSNRAQYMRPAKDTQNSRALASAFSTMNRAFSRIAQNEQRLEAQRQQDEYRDKLEEQQELERQAMSAAALDSLTNQDRANLYVNNPRALEAYNEGMISGELQKGLNSISQAYAMHDAAGDPMRTQELEEFLGTELQNLLANVPPGIAANQIQSIMTRAQDLRNQNALEVYETSKNNSISASGSILLGEMSTSENFGASFEKEKQVLYETYGAAGNDMAVKALQQSIILMGNGSDADFAQRSVAVTEMLANPDIMNNLSTSQRIEIQDAYNRAVALHNNDVQARQRQRQESDALIRADLKQQLFRSLLSGDGQHHDIKQRAFVEHDIDFSNDIDTFYRVMGQPALPDTSENRVQSARVLNQAKFELDRQNMSPLDPEFSDALSALRSQLTDSDFNELIDFKPNLDVEAFSTPNYQFYETELRAFVDLLGELMPPELLQEKGIAELIGDAEPNLPGGSKLHRAIMAEVRAELKRKADTFPEDTKRQSEVVSEAFTGAVMNMLTTKRIDFIGTEPKSMYDTLFTDDVLVRLQGNAMYELFIEQSPAAQRIVQNREAFVEDMADGIDQLMAD